MKRRLVQFGCVGTITALLLSNIGCTSLAQQMASTDYKTQSNAQRTYEQLPTAEQAIVQKELAEIAKNNEDYRVRREAVENLTDQVVLAGIAKTDRNSLVREGAVKNLIDQDVLAEISKTDKNTRVREGAVKKLTNQSGLADIAKTDKYSWVREAAIEKVTDQNLLADVAKNAADTSMRMAAIEKLTDQNVLADIAETDKDSKVRETALAKVDESHPVKQKVKQHMQQQMDADFLKTYKGDRSTCETVFTRVTNQDLLADIAKTDSDSDVRCVAVKNLTNQDALAEIAKTDKYYWVRKTAVEKITGQVVLAEIVKTDKNDSVRAAAFEKLTDQNVLAEVAKNAKNWQVRAVALEKVTDQNALAEVAKNAKDSFNRCKAVDKLTEQKLIVDVVKTGIAPDADAGERFHWTLAVRKLTDQALLADLAKNAEDSFIRCAAIRGLADQDMLVDMAKNDSDADVREAAAWSLEDSHPLKQMKYAEVAKNEANPNERIKAVQKLTDINALIALLKTEKSKEVVEQITKRINEQNVLEDIPSFDSIDFNKHFGTTFGNVAAGNYRLTENVKLESSIRIPAGNTVRINLENYSISGADILVSQGARLELYNGKIAYSSENDGLNSLIIPADNQIRNHGFLVLNKELSQIPVLNEGTGHLRFVEHNFLLKGGKYDVDKNTEIDIGYGRLIGHIVRDGKIVPHSGKPITFKSEDKDVGAVIVKGALPGKFIARLPRPYFAEERPSSIEGLVDLVIVEE